MYQTLREILSGETHSTTSRQKLPPGPITGLPTGFEIIDQITKGLQPRSLIVVAGASGSGKSSFALNIAQHAAFWSKKPIVFFSLETSGEQVSRRLICSQARVDSQKLKSGKLDEYDWDKLAAASNRLSETPIVIDDTAEATPMAIKVIARRIQQEHGLGLIVVDYLQLMRAVTKYDDREEELTMISGSLKAIAENLEVPVLVCTQLDRGVEERKNKRPLLSDLRESGSIEQDADIVMFIYRDELYNTKSDKNGIAEISIAKHRNGPLTVQPIELVFIAQYTKFAPKAPNYREEGGN